MTISEKSSRKKTADVFQMSTICTSHDITLLVHSSLGKRPEVALSVNLLADFGRIKLQEPQLIALTRIWT